MPADGTSTPARMRSAMLIGSRAGAVSGAASAMLAPSRGARQAIAASMRDFDLVTILLPLVIDRR